MTRSVHGVGIGVFHGWADMPTGDPAVFAKRAEALGFAACWLPERTVIPATGLVSAWPEELAGTLLR